MVPTETPPIAPEEIDASMQSGVQLFQERISPRVQQWGPVFPSLFSPSVCNHHGRAVSSAKRKGQNPVDL